MTHDEAEDVDVNDHVQVRVYREGWVPGRVVDINYDARKDYRFDIITEDGRWFAHVHEWDIRWGPRGNRKQDWSPRGPGRRMKKA